MLSQEHLKGQEDHNNIKREVLLKLSWLIVFQRIVNKKIPNLIRQQIEEDLISSVKRQTLDIILN